MEERRLKGLLTGHEFLTEQEDGNRLIRGKERMKREAQKGKVKARRERRQWKVVEEPAGKPIKPPKRPARVQGEEYEERAVTTTESTEIIGEGTYDCPFEPD